jgi:hypothetical protein
VGHKERARKDRLASHYSLIRCAKTRFCNIYFCVLQTKDLAMICKHCGHPEVDHGPACGRWRDTKTGEWDIIIPGRLCFWAENQGYQEDLCACPGFEAGMWNGELLFGGVANFTSYRAKAGV